MAKFAVALCVLLVACSGAQASDVVDRITSWVSDRVEEFGDNIKNAADDLATKWTDVLRRKEQFIRDTRNNIQEAVDRFEEKTAEVTANIQDASSCVSQGGDFKNRAEKIGETVEVCASESSARLETSYAEAKDALEAFKSALDQFKAQTEECTATKNVLSCAWEAGSEMREEIGEEWISLWTEVKSLAKDFLNHEGTLAECRRTEGFEALVEEADEAAKEIESCLKDLKKD